MALTIAGVPAAAARVTHYRVDREHSNTYEVWKKMGSPQAPSTGQLAALEKAGTLHELEPPRSVAATQGKIAVTFSLPRQGVSLVKLTW